MAGRCACGLAPPRRSRSGERPQGPGSRWCRRSRSWKGRHRGAWSSADPTNAALGEEQIGWSRRALPQVQRTPARRHPLVVCTTRSPWMTIAEGNMGRLRRAGCGWRLATPEWHCPLSDREPPSGQPGTGASSTPTLRDRVPGLHRSIRGPRSPPIDPGSHVTDSPEMAAGLSSPMNPVAATARSARRLQKPGHPRPPDVVILRVTAQPFHSGLTRQENDRPPINQHRAQASTGELCSY